MRLASLQFFNCLHTKHLFTIFPIMGINKHKTCSAMFKFRSTSILWTCMHAQLHMHAFKPCSDCEALLSREKWSSLTVHNISYIFWSEEFAQVTACGYGFTRAIGIKIMVAFMLVGHHTSKRNREKHCIYSFIGWFIDLIVARGASTEAVNRVWPLISMVHVLNPVSS